ncbi:hypothetical protein ONZ45_g4323 [Pleurotus djamor]|nr:hypothetical protein ONZ45_g4323 [Pleurotus djamor]
MTIRLRRREQVANASSGTDGHRAKPSHGTALTQNHFAARITPFGSIGGEAPRFVHAPGANMRVATRRSDGGWHFSDPRAPLSPMSPYPFTTDGHDSALPSPAPSALTFTTYSSNHPLLRSDHGHSPVVMSSKEREAQMYAERSRSQLNLHDSEYALEEAPPAYVYDSRESTRGRSRRGSLPPTPH